MKRITLIFGSLYGMLSIIFGAFGAHSLKKILSAHKLISFEIGVKYMMYHAILLLVLGILLKFETALEKNISRLIIIGTAFFSISIYILAFSELVEMPTKILGPITPIGGFLMIFGWAGLLLYSFKSFKK